MAYSILLLTAAWLLTAAAVLTLARHIAVRPARVVRRSPAAAPALADDGAVVALVPRVRNRVVPVGLLEQAA